MYMYMYMYVALKISTCTWETNIISTFFVYMYVTFQLHYWVTVKSCITIQVHIKSSHSNFEVIMNVNSATCISAISFLFTKFTKDYRNTYMYITLLSTFKFTICEGLMLHVSTWIIICPRWSGIAPLNSA